MYVAYISLDQGVSGFCCVTGTIESTMILPHGNDLGPKRS